ncbi:hypothetical protein PHYPSEUDO_007178 [Phytophthora pseudosyringae]|uniref:Uncharacterized protein n=1 Tax=Phytophthora pseudosyringae TaxID=221518 RepID=A0A8T1VHN9_9STRA|nr:hypothetical protein PHYPSEUDO_007178 [Phytophthora pseudosyringae]
MELARSVVDGLLTISELRDAVRHQRYANRRTYLQLMELQAEFKASGNPLHGHARMRRSKIVNKFGRAVLKFSRYLQKYARMHRARRIFKYRDMADERQEIVDEIDQVFRMLNFSTSIKVKDGAGENALTLLAKLEDTGGELKLSHDQIQVELSSFVELRNSLTPKRPLQPILKKTLGAKESTLTLDDDEQNLGMPAVNNVVENEASKHRTRPLIDSVPQLIQTLSSDQSTDHQIEKTLLLLINECADSSNRVQLYEAGGIPVLEHLVRAGASFWAKLYALHCLSWFTFSYAMIDEDEFDELRGCIRPAKHTEILALVHDLQHGTATVKEAAAIRCSCLTTRGEGVTLRRVGVIPPLVILITDGTDNQKLWAAETLVALASENNESCVEVTDAGAIPPLVTLLRSGTDMQKQEAAYALGSLAASNNETRGRIAQEGAIPPMVAFMQAATDVQTQWAVYALGFLSLNHERNRVLIAQQGAIPPLVAMVRGGTNPQKQWAAYTLGNLALSYKNRVAIKLEGAIAPLVTLLESGNELQKQRAAYAVGKLACSGDEVEAAVELDQAILPLVQLVRSGSGPLRKAAACALGKLAANDDGHSETVRIVAPMVELLTLGTRKQKQWSAYALGRLAKNGEKCCAAIVQGGAVEPLLELAETGTKKLKRQATRTLELVSRRMTPTFVFPAN